MGTETVTSNDVLEELHRRHTSLLQAVQPLLNARREARQQFEQRLAEEDESKRPTDEERAAYDAEEAEFAEEFRRRTDELRQLTSRIEQEETVARSLALAQSASRGEVEVGNGRMEISEPMIYRRDNQGQHSYFLDLAAHQNQEVRAIPNAKLEGYQERLERHAKQMGDAMPKRWQARKRQAEAQLQQAENAVQKRWNIRQDTLAESPFTWQSELEHRRLEAEYGALEQRAPSRIVGQGGYAIPPLWLIDEYIPALRPGRVAAGLCRQMPLPDGTDSINIPRLLTPTLTGIQGADSSPVVSRDFSDTFQQANVKTIAGQEDVPIQLIEQSPGQILDRVLMTDLIADYNKQVDVQVLTGNGTGAPLSGGQVVGIYPAANWGATTVSIAAFGGSSPYVPAQAEFFQFLGAIASKTAYSRFNLVDFNYVMHPRRHFWSVTGLDQLGRPLGSDDGFGPNNAQEIEVGQVQYEGYAGRVPFGPNVYIDANVPITDNGSGAPGGTSDVVIGAIWDDLWLFEGDLRTRVLAEVLSGTLELRFQVYAYIAFLARYGVSIALGYGAAMSAPYTYSGSSNGAAF